MQTQNNTNPATPITSQIPDSQSPNPLQQVVDKNYIRDIVRKHMFCFRTKVALDPKTAIVVEAYNADNKLVSVKVIAPHELAMLQTIKNNITKLGFTAKFLTNNKKIQLP